MPLDVIAGLTEGGTCVSEAGPTVEVHMQVHPEDPHRFVNVIVLEEYLSDKHMKEWADRVDELEFRRLKDTSKKFLRVSSDLGLFGEEGQGMDAPATANAASVGAPRADHDTPVDSEGADVGAGGERRCVCVCVHGFACGVVHANLLTSVLLLFCFVFLV